MILTTTVLGEHQEARLCLMLVGWLVAHLPGATMVLSTEQRHTPSKVTMVARAFPRQPQPLSGKQVTSLMCPGPSQLTMVEDINTDCVQNLKT